MGLLGVLGLTKRTVVAQAPKTTAPPVVAGDGDDDKPTPKATTQPGTAPPVTTPPVTAGDGKKDKPAPPVKVPTEYETQRDAARKLLDALKKHKQKAHVAAETGKATTHLTKAASEAGKNDMVKALAEVEEARKACVAGKGFADAYADYMLKRAEAVAAVDSAVVTGWTGETKAGILAADVKAAARNYPVAKTDLEAVITPLAQNFKTTFIDDVMPKIATLKAHKAAKFVKKELTQIDTLQQGVADALAAKLWRKMHLNAIRIGAFYDTPGGLFDTATRMADRRVVFDDQRVLTVAAIAGVKAKPMLAAQMAPLGAALLQADALASKAQMQIDDGVKALQALIERCTKLLALDTAALAYIGERSTVDATMIALGKHVAAKKIATELAALRKQLDSAAALAGNPPTGPHGTIGPDASKHNFAAARVVLTQLSADAAAAKEVADGLTGVAAAEATAGGKAPDAKQLQQAVDNIRKDAVAARKAPHADLAIKRLDNCDAALKEAEAKLAGKKPEIAAQVLIGASLELVAARKIQVEKARFVAAHKLLDDRRKALAALPVGKAIATCIDALAKALAEATKQDKAAAWPEAMAALRVAETAAGAADAAAVARKAHDDRAALLKTKVGDVKYAKIKGAQEKSLKQANALADKLDFAGAIRSLNEIDNRIEAADIEKLATTAPGDAKLVQAAQRMMAKGGQKEIDALIQRLPNTVDKAVIEKLAKARFDLDVVADAGTEAQKSLKQMCKLMSTVPPDVVTRNPSLKKVERIAAGGAFYEGNANRVVMNARPGDSPKADFVKGVKGRLPDKREKECEPANTKSEDLFDFNMLHELAHAIDDANNFMASHADDDTYGGWHQHGGNVEPIAAQVAAKTGFDGSAEERRYVLDKILLGSSAVPPDPPEGDAKLVDAWNKRMQAVDDWHAAATTEGVWSSQANSTSIAMKDGRIYHEAYKGTWVSYPASARSRGITGYQFRAPGEWFSELYAAYKLGKLRPKHPSVGWLSKLSI